MSDWVHASLTPWLVYISARPMTSLQCDTENEKKKPLTSDLLISQASLL